MNVALRLISSLFRIQHSTCVQSLCSDARHFGHLNRFLLLTCDAPTAVTQMVVKMFTLSCVVLCVARYPDGSYPSVQARNNWWGRNHLSFVAGRIWERRDDDNLIRVEYQPYLPDNTSVLHGTNVQLTCCCYMNMHYIYTLWCKKTSFFFILLWFLQTL